eukprot:1937982-Pyramimonas_sp.AAC.1
MAPQIVGHLEEFLVHLLHGPIRHMKRSNQTQEARVHSQGGPIGHRKRGYILRAVQSDTGSA